MEQTVQARPVHEPHGDSDALERQSDSHWSITGEELVPLSDRTLETSEILIAPFLQIQISQIGRTILNFPRVRTI
jgi:hypothetical protein